jgi:hypothetical protein
MQYFISWTISSRRGPWWCNAEPILNLFLNISECIPMLIILSLVCGDYYKTGIGLTTGFIGSHSYTQLQCIRSTAHYSSLAESSHCIYTRCLSSNIAGSVRLQLCNSSLKTAALTEDSSYIASGPDPKENTSTLLCWTRPRRKQQFLRLLRAGWGQTT